MCSGANINFNNLRLVADLADLGSRKEAILVSTIPEKVGSFKKFVDTALSGTDIQVTEFRYRFSASNDAHIMWSIGIQTQKDTTKVLRRLNNHFYTTIDVSEVSECQTLIKFFVGGRPRCYMGHIPNEKIFKVKVTKCIVREFVFQ